VVLMMDANEPSIHGSAVNRIGLKCGLVDAHLLSLDISTAPATHQCGTHKIDFILISPRLVAAVKTVSVLPLHNGYTLDHHALCIDFNAKILFQSKTSPVVPPTQWRLTSTNPTVVTKYMKTLLAFIVLHNIEDKVGLLFDKSKCGLPWTAADSTTFEQIDQLLAQGSRR
jgi:hypothetical protein